MKDEEKKGAPQDTTKDQRPQERVNRREAMKRMAKGIALVGTLGVTAVITQGQDECTGGYVNGYSNSYYNYSYYNYANMYTAYTEYYYNYYDYNNYYNYYDYSNYQNYYDYYNH
jgi:hypothetical protein